MVDRLVVRLVVRSVVNFNSYPDSVHFGKKYDTVLGRLVNLKETSKGRGACLVEAYKY